MKIENRIKIEMSEGEVRELIVRDITARLAGMGIFPSSITVNGAEPISAACNYAVSADPEEINVASMLQEKLDSLG